MRAKGSNVLHKNEITKITKSFENIFVQCRRKINKNKKFHNSIFCLNKKMRSGNPNAIEFSMSESTV